MIRGEQIDRAVAEYFRRRRAGEQVSPETFAATAPHLAPELLEQLHRLLQADSGSFRSETGIIEKQLQQQSTIILGPLAAEEDDPMARAGSANLQIRCPECHEEILLAADAPWDRIECRHCGGIISLVGSAVATQRAATLQAIGHFELIERLGVGGFGTVWKARDTVLQRTVAIKIPRKGALSEPEAEQFLREARAAAQLSHPNIVSVHEVGREHDTPYIVSDYVRGVSLMEWVAAHHPTPHESVRVCERIARALHHAHQAGIIHRDVKPGNILVDDQHQPHIMDFGLAKRSVSDITMTLDGQIIGTPAYMPPEQARGDIRSIDARSDVYSLGAVLYQMLTGELPFRGNVRMLVYQVIHEDPPAPRKLNNTIPRDLDTICLKCLEKDAARRYGTAEELADEFQRYLAGHPIHARPLGLLTRAVRWIHHNQLVAMLTAAILVALTTGTVVSAWLAVGYMRVAEEKAQQQAELAANTQALQKTLDELLAAQRRAIAARRDLAARGQYNTQLMRLSNIDSRFQPKVARQLLSECAPQQRDFAWRWYHQILCLPGVALREHMQGVTSLQFSRQGTWFASHGQDQQLLIYTTPDFLPHSQTIIPTAEVTRWRIADTKAASLAWQATPQSVRWGVAHDFERAVEHQFSGPILDFQFSLSGEELWVLVGDPTPPSTPDSADHPTSGPGQLWRWSSRSGAPEALSPDGPFPRASAFALSPDDRLVALQVSEGIEVWPLTPPIPGQATTRLQKREGALQLTGFVLDQGVPQVAYLEPNREPVAAHPFHHSLWNVQTNQHRVLGIFTASTHPLIPTWAGPMLSRGPDGQSIMIHDRRSLYPQMLLNENAATVPSASAISPHGDWVATGDPSGTVILRKLNAHGRLNRDATPAVAFACHPQGRYVAVADINNGVRLYDIDSGESVRELSGQHSRIVSLAFSADGKSLASCSRDRTMVIWNLDWSAAPEETVRQFRTDQEMQAIHFGGNSEELLTRDVRGSMALWDLHVPKVVAEEAISRAPSDQAFSVTSADGQWTVNSQGLDTLEVRRLAEGFPAIQTIRWERSPITCLALSNRGMLAVADGQRRVTLYDLSQPVEICDQGSFQLPDPVRGSPQAISSLSFSQDDQILAITDHTSRVHIWDVQAREQRAFMNISGTDSPSVNAQFCPSRDVLVIMSAQGDIDMINVGAPPATHRRLAEDIPFANLFCGVTYLRDKMFLGPSSDDHSICAWSSDGVVSKTLNSPKGVQWPLCMAVATSPNVVAVGHSNGDVSIAESLPKTSHHVHLFRAHDRGVSSCAFVGSPATLVTTQGRALKAWSIEGDSKRTATLAAEVEVNSAAGWVTSLAGSPTSHWLAWGTHLGQVTLCAWPDLANAGSDLPTNARGRVRHVRFSPDGTLLAVAADQLGLELWRVADRQKLHSMLGHVGPILALDFSADGQWIVTGGQDQTLRFWSTRSGTCLETIQTHQGWVYGVACQPDNQGVVSLGTNRTLQFIARDLAPLHEPTTAPSVNQP